MTKQIFFKDSGEWTRIQEAARNTVAQLFVQVAQFNWLEPYKIRNQYERRATAFFINEEGYLVTNAHVVNEATISWIHLPSFGKKSFFVEVVGFCPARDLALLRLKDEDCDFIRAELGAIPWIPLGDSDTVQRTDKILVLGYPLGQYRLKSSTGIMSGRESGGGRSLLQITAPINPGNSGGPLLNGEGQVVGIAISAIFPSQNVGYAIPINELRLILDDLHQTKFVRRGMLGIRFNFSTDEQAHFLGNPVPAGFYINRVFSQSLAQQAGLQEGDMLYEFNGFQVDAFGETVVAWTKDKISIHDLISRLKNNDDVDLLIYRDGEQKRIRFPFAVTDPYPIRAMFPDYESIEYEIIAGMVIMQLSDNHIPFLSEIVPYLIDYAKMENKVDPRLVITHILPGSQAHQVRSLSPGYIIHKLNGITVKTLDEFRSALQESVKSTFVTVKTLDNIFVVFSCAQVLKDEHRLSKDFFYPISSTVKKLMQEVSHEKKTA